MSTNGWPEETPEQLIEKVRAARGDEEARLFAKALGMPEPPRKKAVPRRVGAKAKAPPAPTGVPAQGAPGFAPFVARSGAPPPPKATPRAGNQRRRRAAE